MTKITRSKACGNSPKNQLVENLSVALLTGDVRTVSYLVSDDVEWRRVGGDVIRGRQALLQSVQRGNGASIVRLTVEHVVTHGRSGAVDGTIQYRGKASGFCDVFEFGNTKGTTVDRITTYRVDT